MTLDDLHGPRAASLRDLRALLRTDMPVTEHLGIIVLGFRSGDLVLKAPLDANVNHQRTAFAGSLNATATLAGWATAWLVMREHTLDAQVVIQDSTVHYVRPVASDFEARCTFPDPDTVERLVCAVRRRGRGRLELTVSVSDADGEAVRFRGRYVAARTSGDTTPG